MRLTCKEASRLLSEGQDSQLALGQRTALRLHFFICTACSRVKKQMDFLRRAAGEYPGPDDHDGKPKT